jgi:hypothetical protein
LLTDWEKHKVVTPPWPALQVVRSRVEFGRFSLNPMKAGYLSMEGDAFKL